MKTMPFSVINSDNVLCFNFGGEINYNEHVHYLEYFLVFDPVKKRKKKVGEKRECTMLNYYPAGNYLLRGVRI